MLALDRAATTEGGEKETLSSAEQSRAEQLYGPLGATQNDEENPGMKIGEAAPSLELPAVLTALETW